MCDVNGSGFLQFEIQFGANWPKMPKIIFALKECFKQRSKIFQKIKQLNLNLKPTVNGQK